MKRRNLLIIAILIMCVGFAAISTILVINGNVQVGENSDDFSVIFTAATLNGTDVYTSVIDDTKKVITFETSDLKTLNQTSVLTYEVTNNSSNYDAEVQVNCKVKDGGSAKYTSIKNELEGNTTTVKAKETLNGILTVTLNKTATEEVKENYVCTLEFNAVERNTLGESILAPVSFATDSWETIQKAVQIGNTSKYNVGDTKEVNLGDLGTHAVRIANKSECTTETSETACGFVVEFTDIIENQSMNSTDTNVGGWKASELRIYINDTIYNALPIELQRTVALTKVVSSHGNISGENNFETHDKLYLLARKEVYSGEHQYDTVDHETKQLDIYKNLNVNTTSYSNVIKNYQGKNTSWWLRSASSYDTLGFFNIDVNGKWFGDGAKNVSGVSPAFRIA